MATIHFDYESFSEVDIGEVGAYHYANHPSTEILMIGLAVDDEEPTLWLPYDFTLITDWYTIEEYQKADAILHRLRDKDTVVYAHNAQFEIAMSDALFEKTTGLKPPQHTQWRCTGAMARRAALPDGLNMLGKVLGLPQQKDKEGKALIDLFSVPQQPSSKTQNAARIALLREKAKTAKKFPAALTKELAKPEFRARVRPEDEPDRFREFTEYCLQDVRVERAAEKRLGFFRLSGMALKSFQADIEINARGFPVNLKALRCAEKIMAEVSPVVTAQFREVTGLNPTQGEKFKLWARERGYPGENLQAETVDAYMESDEFDPDSELGQAMILRNKVNFAAIQKIPKMLMMAGPHDNRVRGTLLWHGAGPGRWTGRGVQPHNFKRPDMSLIKNYPWKENGFKDTDAALDAFTQQAYSFICSDTNADELEMFFGDPLDVLASCIRHFIHDSHECQSCEECGCMGIEHCDACDDTGMVTRSMLSCDYSAIEAVLLAWLAGEQWRLEVFRTHGKIYEASASKMFGIPIEEVTKPLRQKGKISELALGYQGAVGALLTMGALKMGLLEEDLPEIVKAWRAANPAITGHWKASENAARNAVKEPGTKFKAGKHISYYCTRVAGMMYLFCVLPGGRLIAYPKPQLEQQLRYVYVDPKKNKKVKVSVLQPTTADIELAQRRVGSRNYYVKESLTVYGEIKDNVMGRFAVHGGILVENQCQGAAADIMIIGIVNLEEHAYELANTIHDEALTYYDDMVQTAEEMEALMLDLPSCYNGLPLRAAGGVVPFYKK